MKFKGI